RFRDESTLLRKKIFDKFVTKGKDATIGATKPAGFHTDSFYVIWRNTLLAFPSNSLYNDSRKHEIFRTTSPQYVAPNGISRTKNAISPSFRHRHFNVFGYARKY